jgi:hypothetical protein
MKKRISLLFFLLAAFITIAHPAMAQAPEPIYVDPFRVGGNEDGTVANPYTSEAEGIAYLQALPYGGDLYVRNADGTWSGPRPIDPAKLGGGGVPLPTATVYLLLAFTALGLIFTGWLLMRRSHQVEI